MARAQPLQLELLASYCIRPGKETRICKSGFAKDGSRNAWCNQCLKNINTKDKPALTFIRVCH